MQKAVGYAVLLLQALCRWEAAYKIVRFCKFLRREVFCRCILGLGSVSKHGDIIHGLSRLVQEQQLLWVSELEQDLATRECRQEHLKTVLRDPGVTTMDKLRLVALYVNR